MLPTVNFDGYPNPVNMTLSPSGLSIAGDTVSLMCSATLVDPVPLPSNVPCPTFEWFFGPNSNASLPSSVNPRSNVSGYTFTSILQFSPLNESHAGMYTCRIGAGRLANSTIISVDGMLVMYMQICSSRSLDMVISILRILYVINHDQWNQRISYNFIHWIKACLARFLDHLIIASVHDLEHPKHPCSRLEPMQN